MTQNMNKEIQELIATRDMLAKEREHLQADVDALNDTLADLNNALAGNHGLLIDAYDALGLEY